MSIAKRAKHNIIVSPRNTQKMKMTKDASKKRCKRNIGRIMKRKTNKSIVSDDNYNFQQYSPKTCKMWQSVLQQSKGQHLAKYNANRNLNISLPIKESETVTKKLNMSSNYLKEINTDKCGELNNVTKGSKHLNPVVYLIQLSKADIEKYTKSKKEILDRKATRIIQTPTLSTTKMHKGRNERDLTLKRLSSRPVYSSHPSRRRKPNKRTLNQRNVHLVQSPSKSILHLNPAVHLKRLSELEIHKHVSSSNTTAYPNDSDSAFTLQRYPNFYIKNYGIVIVKRGQCSPEVYLKLLPERKIQKHVSSTNTTAYPNDLDSGSMLQRYPNFYIKTDETVNDKKVQSKSELVSETSQLQNNDVSAYWSSKFETSNNANPSRNIIDFLTKWSRDEQSKSLTYIPHDIYPINKLLEECSQPCL